MFNAHTRTHTHKEMSKMETVSPEQEVMCARAEEGLMIKSAQCELLPHKSCGFQPELIQMLSFQQLVLAASSTSLTLFVLHTHTHTGWAKVSTEAFSFLEKVREVVRLCLRSFSPWPWLYQRCLRWVKTQVWHQCHPPTPRDFQTTWEKHPRRGVKCIWKRFHWLDGPGLMYTDTSCIDYTTVIWDQSRAEQPLFHHSSCLQFAVNNYQPLGKRLQWFGHCLCSGLVPFTYRRQDMCVCLSVSGSRVEPAHIVTDTEKPRVIRETKTRVSTSGDRGGGAQAVKLWEVLFGRTIGWIEQVEATWKRTDSRHTHRQMETDVWMRMDILVH